MAAMARAERARKMASALKRLRRGLGLTQAGFAKRYRIPLGTLRDWEQGRAAPDGTAWAYLLAICGDPEAVWRALRGPG